jgi:transcriptional regulator with XRE-family HTH domain
VPAHELGTRVAAKVNKQQKKEGPYKEALAFWDGLVGRTLKSIRHDRDFKRKKIAAHLGLEDYNVRNMERSHRRVRAGDLFLFAAIWRIDPIWLVKEILRRNEDEIRRWLQKEGFRWAGSQQPEAQVQRSRLDT